MTNLLLRLFVKNYKDYKNPKIHSAIGKLAGITGIVCNVLLTLGKCIVGIGIGSMAIIADGINNLSDSMSSILTFFGFRLSQRPADKNHPYGHARYEYLSGLAIAAMILLVGAELVKSSIDKIIHPQTISVSVGTVVVLAASILLKLWMSVFYKSLGKRISSATLRASSVDSRNDVIATSAVLLGCLASYFFELNLDGYIGLAVSLFIIYSGISLAKETISPLLGQRADRETVEDLSRLILSHDKVLGIHDLLIHDYGSGQRYASVHMELSADEEPLVCHDIIDEIERTALETMNLHLVIHYDPVVENDDEQNEMKQLITEIISELDARFSIHDFRVARGAKQKKLVFDLSVPYSDLNRCAEIKGKIDEALGKKGKEYITVIHFDGKA